MHQINLSISYQIQILLMNENQINKWDHNVLFPPTFGKLSLTKTAIVICNIWSLLCVVLYEENDFSNHQIDKIIELGMAQDHCLNLMGQQIDFGHFSYNWLHALQFF